MKITFSYLWENFISIYDKKLIYECIKFNTALMRCQLEKKKSKKFKEELLPKNCRTENPNNDFTLHYV